MSLVVRGMGPGATLASAGMGNQRIPVQTDFGLVYWLELPRPEELTVSSLDDEKMMVFTQGDKNLNVLFSGNELDTANVATATPYLAETSFEAPTSIVNDGVLYLLTGEEPVGTHKMFLRTDYNNGKRRTFGPWATVIRRKLL